MGVILAFIGILVAMIAVGLLYRIWLTLDDIAEELASSRRPERTAFPGLGLAGRGGAHASDEARPPAGAANARPRRETTPPKANRAAWVLTVLGAVAAALVLKAVYVVTSQSAPVTPQAFRPAASDGVGPPSD
jgi:hypothetical protein